MSQIESAGVDSLSRLPVLVWRREAYAQELRAGPTLALEHLRHLWNQCPPGDLPLDCELLKALTVLRERFVNPDELQNWGGHGIVRET